MSQSTFKAVIFDLDGVLTRTATLHARAWKEMFDEFLEEREGEDGENHAPFDIEEDYLRYVDGKPRLDGIRSFLDSREITLPEGEEGDPPERETVWGLGRRKNDRFLELLEAEGAEVFEDAVEQLDAWRDRGLRTALITSSRNGRRILRTAGLDDRFEVTVDGNDAARLGIPGKPAPDIFLHAARELEVDPAEAVVIEDAISGVEAGRAGGFGLVIGIARNGGDGLRQGGAHVVVKDLREVDALPEQGGASERERRDGE